MGGSTSKLSPELLVELQKSTHFDKKEIQQWYRGFIKDCPKGSLNLEQFKEMYKQYFPFGDSSTFAELMFAVFDENQDRLIDFKEFLTALSITSKGQMDEKLQWAFRLYDQNNDGYISYDEMLVVVGSIYKMMGGVTKLSSEEDTPEKRVRNIFRLMGVSPDGQISIQEFHKGAKEDETILQSLQLFNGLV
ncbi:putative FRQ1-regulator of phosphatidylinositol-4-OH kinase [Polychytrium aggregatum]|uniref:putative FRQ1-regulator of phosphatidylinositol-4-OH kinase n=1 Tax=Polychytrium aggregatum TaxID=110093 RepID=UPI0022FE20B1|nr:putative FRQ1-regulator of phosphatidylinositol-4-OH kinase [Polychytrium aggregatum]KAI9208655.1 putative FRQ1-regulator of phosphatidylinositol-4-OH kinase [Polychytrium aggregatum]